MTTIFTPYIIIKKRRSRLLVGLLIFTLTVISTQYLALPSHVAATEVSVWNDGVDFASGTNANTVINSLIGEVTLGYLGTSTTHTTEADFNGRSRTSNTENYATVVVEEGNGEISLNSGWKYDPSTTPATGASFTQNSFLQGELLYIATWGGGVSVIDTQGTRDPADDTLHFNYTKTSNPALVGAWANYVHEITLVDDLLYFATYSGLTVIDTQGTKTVADDVTLMAYTNSSVPALTDSYVRHVVKNDTFLYVGTNSGGLTVIDTQGTGDPLDDTVHFNFNTVTGLVAGGDNIRSISIFGDFVYVGTDGGVDVIDTQGTATTSDDVVSFTYSTTSNPSIVDDIARSIFQVGDLIYFGTENGITVIDSQGTENPLDDTAHATYSITSQPPLLSNFVKDLFVEDNQLYVVTDLGVNVIDTKGTTNFTDDTLTASYNSNSVPALPVDNGTYAFVVDKLIYISTVKGLAVVSKGGDYSSPSARIGLSNPLASTSNTFLNAEALLTDGHAVSLNYRTATSGVVWFNGFDDGDLTDIRHDLYENENIFQTVSESEGVLRLSDPSDVNSALFWIDTEKGVDYFPAGSVIRIKSRMNVVDDSRRFSGFISTDDHESAVEYMNQQNEWAYSTKIADQSFNYVYIGSRFSVETFLPGDYLEVDWIQVEAPNESWNSWSPDCNELRLCTVDPADLTGNDWIQYKVNLSTSDSNTTPLVGSVTFSDGYQPSGVYTSEPQVYKRAKDLISFNADVATSASTSVAFEYSTDEGETWDSINPGVPFSEDVRTDHFQWRAILTTTDSSYTPVINSVSFTTVGVPLISGTSLNTQIKKLIENNQEDKARELESRFNNDENKDWLSDVQVKRRMVVILKEIIVIQKRIIELKSEGGDLEI